MVALMVSVIDILTYMTYVCMYVCMYVCVCWKTKCLICSIFYRRNSRWAVYWIVAVWGRILRRWYVMLHAIYCCHVLHTAIDCCYILLKYSIYCCYILLYIYIITTNPISSLYSWDVNWWSTSSWKKCSSDIWDHKKWVKEGWGQTCW